MNCIYKVEFGLYILSRIIDYFDYIKPNIVLIGVLLVNQGFLAFDSLTSLVYSKGGNLFVE